MVAIDTNVVSESMRPTPDHAGMAWLSVQDSAGLYLTAVAEAELRAGAEGRMTRPPAWVP